MGQVYTCYFSFHLPLRSGASKLWPTGQLQSTGPSSVDHGQASWILPQLPVALRLYQDAVRRQRHKLLAPLLAFPADLQNRWDTVWR